jgi:hypothetical protein
LEVPLSPKPNPPLKLLKPPKNSPRGQSIMPPWPLNAGAGRLRFGGGVLLAASACLCDGELNCSFTPDQFGSPTFGRPLTG